MLQPVDKIDFWRDRIADAHHRGREHFSVFIAHQTLWDKITASHSAIIKRETAGLKTLDAGCGYGRVSQWVDDYTGVDFSPDFIKLANAKYPGKRFMVGDLTALPFKDGEFDVAVCVSIRGMVVGNLGQRAWDIMEKEVKRVAKKVLVLEYEEEQKYWIL